MHIEHQTHKMYGLPEAAQHRLREREGGGGGEGSRMQPKFPVIASFSWQQQVQPLAQSLILLTLHLQLLQAQICCYSENAERYFSRCEAAVLTLQSSVAYTYDQQQRLCGLSAAEHRASRPETWPTENQYSGLQALLILARQQYGIT